MTSFGQIFASFTPTVGSMNHILARNHDTGFAFIEKQKCVEIFTNILIIGLLIGIVTYLSSF